MSNEFLPGRSFPLGATVYPTGVNFSVYSKNANSLELLFFDQADDAKPSRRIQLLPNRNHQTFHYWHVFVPGITAGQIYAYRVDGPFAPEDGLRFDNTKLLLDPYGRSVAVPENYDRLAAERAGENTATAMKSVVTDPSAYDWEGDQPLNTRFAKTVIYEMHVGAFTAHPNSGVAADRRGTYAGLIEKIPYLKELGVTAVELLPIFQFDPQEAPDGLVNYWGYNPVSFFAPHVGYSSSNHPLRAIDEFRDLVKALHRSGIEVILDVVYNHTAEGNESGPTFCFRGFENDAYYILSKTRDTYMNYSGTGNSLNANHSIVRRLILDSLRYWVTEMHVDGFRFDLASVLSRNIKGKPVANPPILWDIETDPILSGTKLIAEAWDAAGLYQVGSFFGDHWKEWNGQFRDDVRHFVKSDPGYSGKLAARFLASPDIYTHQPREPERSINFVTCHDGFTMQDLVSYNVKHNLANHENDQDGHNDNISWNCGVEGPTDDPEIIRRRQRQVKNLFTINLLALGVPMLLMGDEAGRTKKGNNNTYCHNNELNWFDWSLLETNADLHRFVRSLIQFRLSLPMRQGPRRSLAELLQKTTIQWHGVRLGQPDWGETSRTLSFSVEGSREWFHLILNSYWEPLSFQLPSPPNRFTNWSRVIDTFLPSPDDFSDPREAPSVLDKEYLVHPRSVILLVANLE
ncbi:MAG: glycogen debranching protein GlgX [Planctomycetaceae bacterium]|nr:glycogen debranching protein GlgX [Planctomycetaceae bacterium]